MTSVSSQMYSAGKVAMIVCVLLETDSCMSIAVKFYVQSQ